MKTVIRLIVIFLLLISGFSACYGGLHLIVNPDGRALGLSSKQLIFLPFKTYLLPGLLLLIVPGLGSLLAAASVATKKLRGPLFAALQGCLLLVWIIVQASVMPDNFVQYFYGSLAICLIASALLLLRLESSHVSDI